MIYIENIVDISLLINILVVWTFIRVLGIHKYIYIYIYIYIYMYVCMYVCILTYSSNSQHFKISQVIYIWVNKKKKLHNMVVG